MKRRYRALSGALAALLFCGSFVDVPARAEADVEIVEEAPAEALPSIEETISIEETVPMPEPEALSEPEALDVAPIDEPLPNPADPSASVAAEATEAATPAETAAPEDAVGPAEALSDFSVEGGVLIAYRGGDRDVTIPSDLGIIEIGPSAFAGNAEIYSVRVPDGVLTIDAGAFRGCSELASILLPAGLQAIAPDAFADCPRLVISAWPDSPALRFCQEAGIPFALLGAAEPTVSPAETPAPGAIQLENGDLTLCVGESATGALRPALTGSAAGFETSIYYTSSNPKIVRVDAANGKLTGVKVGSAAVTASLKHMDQILEAGCTVTVCKAPAKIQMSVAKTLGVGERAVPIISTPTKDARVGAYTLTSNKPSVIAVEGDSIVALAAGTATVTAKNFNKKSASVKISVKEAPTALRFTSRESPLGVGMAHPLTAAVNDGAAGVPIYSIVRGAEFATLEGNVLTANTPGEVTVRAEVYNGVFAEQTLTILPAPAALTVAPQSVEIGVNETIAAPVSVASDTGADPKLSYKSSNSKIVSVTASGAITGKKAGTAEITVTAYNGVAASYAVTVCKAPAKIQMSVAKTLGVGERVVPIVSTPTKDARVGAYTLTSNKPSVVVVEGDSIVALAAGTATVTAKNYNKKSVSVKISVKEAPAALRFTSGKSPLGVGMAHPLTAAVDEGAAGVPVYSIVRGAEFATLEGNVLTANAPGEVVVRAEVYNGVFAEQTLAILPAPAALTVAPMSVEIGVNETVAAPVAVASDTGADPKLSYKSSNSKIVSVTASGAITGKKAGTAEITVTAYNGIAASYAVTVRKAPAKIQMSVAKTLGVGERAVPIVSTPTKDARVGAYTLTSNMPSVVAVEGDSIVAMVAGTATITAKNFNKKTASVKISVKEAPTALRFTSGESPLGVGMAHPLAAAVDDGAAGIPVYSIVRGAEFATLEGNVLTANAPGEVIVRAEVYNGVFAEQTLTILPAPTSISLRETELQMGLKEKRADALHIALSEGSGGSACFRSTDAKIVSVDAESGALTALKKGTAYVYAVTYNGLETGRCKITVQNAPSKITLSVPRTEIGVGQDMAATVNLNANASGGWTLVSSDPSVVEVRDVSTLAAVGAGVAKITATSFNKKTSSVEIRVTAAPSYVVPAKETYYLYEGQRSKVTFRTPGSYSDFTYRSSDPETVSVESDGSVTGLRLGEATVTATTYNGLEASVPVCVCLPPDELQCAEPEVTIGVGDLYAFPLVTIPERSAAAYYFASSNRSVATVDEDGVVSGLKAGTAVISVTSHNGHSTQMRVHVVRYDSLHRTIIVAHRGASGYCKDNTLEAFRRAAELGADGIETDLRLTGDGRIVLHHDGAIGGRSISGLTLEQLKRIDPDVPTLEEALECLSALPLQLNLEFKTASIEIERMTLELVRRYGLEDRTVYHSFDVEGMRRLKAMDPSVAVNVATQSTTLVKDVIAHPDEYSFLSGVSIRYDLITADIVRSLHLLGFKVMCWTVNSAKDIQRMSEMGLDNITTNYPDRA